MLFATGVFITDPVNKVPLVIAFLGAYYALFFAFFMLTDPPTSPTRYPDQILCGILVATASYAIFEWLGAVHYLSVERRARGQYLGSLPLLARGAKVTSACAKD